MSPPPPSRNPYARTETESNRKQRERLEAYRLEIADAYRRILATPTGRRLLWHILDFTCGYFRNTDTGEDRSTAMANGRRAVALDLIGELQEFAPEQFVLLTTENLARAVEQLATTKREAQ